MARARLSARLRWFVGASHTASCAISHGLRLAIKPMFVAAPSSALTAFLQQFFTSVDQIDIVILLMTNDARAWTAPEVAAAVGTPTESAAMRLFLLASSGLISFETSGIPRYRYLQTDPERHALLCELAGLLASNRPSVLALVGGTPPDPLRSFADAFKLKK